MLRIDGQQTHVRCGPDAPDVREKTRGRPELLSARNKSRLFVAFAADLCDDHLHTFQILGENGEPVSLGTMAVRTSTGSLAFRRPEVLDTCPREPEDSRSGLGVVLHRAVGGKRTGVEVLIHTATRTLAKLEAVRLVRM